jgi:hypothetical protein
MGNRVARIILSDPLYLNRLCGEIQFDHGPFLPAPLQDAGGAAGLLSLPGCHSGRRTQQELGVFTIVLSLWFLSKTSPSRMRGGNDESGETQLRQGQ